MQFSLVRELSCHSAGQIGYRHTVTLVASVGGVGWSAVRDVQVNLASIDAPESISDAEALEALLDRVRQQVACKTKP